MRQSRALTALRFRIVLRRPQTMETCRNHVHIWTYCVSSLRCLSIFALVVCDFLRTDRAAASGDFVGASGRTGESGVQTADHVPDPPKNASLEPNIGGQTLGHSVFLSSWPPCPVSVRTGQHLQPKNLGRHGTGRHVTQVTQARCDSSHITGPRNERSWTLGWGSQFHARNRYDGRTQLKMLKGKSCTE